MKNEFVVIMAGGVGTRFWPMSRTAHPKQFLDILGTGKTLIQQTYERFLPICSKENIFIVTNEIYKGIVMQQLPDINENQVLCEPSRRNTAPCIAYACFKIASINPNANIIVAPSDHLILNQESFIQVVRKAMKTTKDKECLVTLGIKPTRPDTGYGYIQFIENESLNGDNKVKKVKTSTEKPDLEMAKFFINSGDFLWNSGIFIWNAKRILNAFEKYLPEEFNLFYEGMNLFNTAGEAAFIKKTYSQCKNISIDYGIMEKANNVYVLSADIGWSDLGTYGSLYEHLVRNENGNSIIGKNVIAYDCENSIINMPKDKVVVLQGLKDIIAVESDGILLICKKSEEQHLRQFVNDVKMTKGEKFV